MPLISRHSAEILVAALVTCILLLCDIYEFPNLEKSITQEHLNTEIEGPFPAIVLKNTSLPVRIDPPTCNSALILIGDPEWITPGHYHYRTVQMYMETIVKPLQADVYVILSYQTHHMSIVLRDLRKLLGRNIVKIIISGGLDADQRIRRPMANWDKCINKPPPPNLNQRADHYIQFYKLKLGWDELTKTESGLKKRYRLVIKGRLDGIPTGLQLNSTFCDSTIPQNEGRAIYSITDHFFFGRRNNFATAVSLWRAILSNYTVEGNWYYPPWGRPINFKRGLMSMLSVHSNAWRKPEWLYYNKVAELNLPSLEGLTRSQDHTTIDTTVLHDRMLNITKNRLIEQGLPGESIKLLRRAVCDYKIHILFPKASDNNFGLYNGSMEKPSDWRPGFRAAERDFVQFLNFHDVTVCDVGIMGVSGYYYKGKDYPHPTIPDCVDQENDRRICDDIVSSSAP
ncbi:hypothetical protein AAMO2058_000347200 [Amorphochlora amoebiformis]